MRRFLALDVSSHSRDEHKSPPRLKRTGIRLRDNRSPPPISHRDRPACRPKPTPEAEIVGAQHRSGHVRDGRHPCRHCLEATPKSLRDNTKRGQRRVGGVGYIHAASPVRRYPTTVSGSRSPGTTAGMPGGYGVICSAATRPTASQRAPAPPLRRTRRGAASPSLAVSPSAWAARSGADDRNSAAARHDHIAATSRAAVSLPSALTTRVGRR